MAVEEKGGKQNFRVGGGGVPRLSNEPEQHTKKTCFLIYIHLKVL